MHYTEEYLRQVLEEEMPGILADREYNRTAPVSGSRGSIDLPDRQIDFVFYPAADPDAPVILGFHGGGYLYGGCALDDAMWRRTAEVLNANIVSVEYRMGPEYQYRESLEDAHEAVRWFAAHDSFEAFSYDPERLMVMGMSAGGNIAAAVCLYENAVGGSVGSSAGGSGCSPAGGSPIRKQILIYPQLDTATDETEKGEGGKAPAPIEYIFSRMHSRPEEARDPLASPAFAEDRQLAGLPDAVIVCAGEDVLRKEAEVYAERLRQNGVHAACTAAEGMPHIYFEHGFNTLEELGEEKIPEEQRDMVRSGRMHEAAEATLAFIRRNL